MPSHTNAALAHQLDENEDGTAQPRGPLAHALRPLLVNVVSLGVVKVIEIDVRLGLTLRDADRIARCAPRIS